MLHASIQPQKCSTQNELLLNNLIEFYSQNDFESVRKMLAVINGESAISLRIIDWFSTNYAKKCYTVYAIGGGGGGGGGRSDKPERRFKVYTDYKLKLKAYSKKRFDPFCRWDRINFPYKNGSLIQTTIGQLNFFKWAIENEVIRYIESNYATIEMDMNARNSISKRKTAPSISDTTGVDGASGIVDMMSDTGSTTTTRKKREELSILASSCIKKETVEVVVKFE
jgi:hypothetical protein